MKIWKSLNNSFFNEDLRPVYKMKGAGGGKYLIKYSLLACLVLRIILIGQGASSDHELEEILKLLMIYNPVPWLQEKCILHQLKDSIGDLQEQTEVQGPSRTGIQSFILAVFEHCLK